MIFESNHNSLHNNLDVVFIMFSFLVIIEFTFQIVKPVSEGSCCFADNLKHLCSDSSYKIFSTMIVSTKN